MSDPLCTICSQQLSGLLCENEWCGEEHFKCNCGDVIRLGSCYEYRGGIICKKCFCAAEELNVLNKESGDHEQRH